VIESLFTITPNIMIAVLGSRYVWEHVFLEGCWVDLLCGLPSCAAIAIAAIATTTTAAASVEPILLGQNLREPRKPMTAVGVVQVQGNRESRYQQERCLHYDSVQVPMGRRQ